MALGKLYLSQRARTAPSRKGKRVTNKKLATIGTVKRLISSQVDRQRHDAQTIVAQNVTTTAQIYNMMSILSANASLNSFKAKVFITNPTLNVAVRLLVFQWKDTTTPVIADLLDYTTDPLSPIGLAGDSQYTCGGKIHILTDMLIPMNTTDKNVKAFTLTYYKKRLLDIKSDNNEIRNLLFFCFLSNTAVTPPVITVTRTMNYNST